MCGKAMGTSVYHTDGNWSAMSNTIAARPALVTIFLIATCEQCLHHITINRTLAFNASWRTVVVHNRDHPGNLQNTLI